MGSATTPISRDRWAVVGFSIPTGLSLIVGLGAMMSTMGDPSGYQGLFFIAAMLFGLPVMVVWLLVGALVGKAKGPPGAARRFAIGAGAGIGASLIILTATCFGSYA